MQKKSSISLRLLVIVTILVGVFLTPVLSPTVSAFDTRATESTPPNAWNLLGLGDQGIYSVALSTSYKTDQTFFFSTYYHSNNPRYTYRSTDGGSSWSQVLNLCLGDIVISPNFINDRTVFGRGDDKTRGVFRSTNGGDNWEAVGLTGLYQTTLAISPTFQSDETLFSGGPDGTVYRSTDQGNSWTSVTRIAGFQVRAIAISPNFASDHIVFAGFGYDNQWTVGGVYKSTDGGNTWSPVNNGLNYKEVHDLVISPNYSEDHTLFVVMWVGGIYKTTDGGENWSNSLSIGRGEALAFSPNYAIDQTIYSGSWGGPVSKSTDGGSTWTKIQDAGKYYHNISVTENQYGLNTLLAGGEYATTRGLYTYVENPISISHIEISQAIQDEENNVTLIANKPTFARVYVDCGEINCSIPNISGTLSAFRDGNQIGEEIQPVNISVTATNQPWIEQRDDLRNSLNFSIPQNWTLGTIDFVATVEGSTLSEPNKVFIETPTIVVGYSPIMNVVTGEKPDEERIAEAYKYASKIFPVSNLQYVKLPTIKWIPFPGCYLLNGTANQNDCLVKTLLVYLKEIYNVTSIFNGTNIFFGWLPGDTNLGNITGENYQNTRIAFGIDNQIGNQETFAHEVGHVLGRLHSNTASNYNIFRNYCAINPDDQPSSYLGSFEEWKSYVDLETDWDLSTTPLIQPHYFGLDAYGLGWLVTSNSPLRLPETTFDYMSYCGRLQNMNSWTSSFTYEKILDRITGRADLLTKSENLEIESQYLVASGLVFSDDNAILNPIHIISSNSTDTPPIGTMYCLQAQDLEGNSLSQACFDLDFLSFETKTITSADIFNVKIPYPTGVSRIVLKKGEIELAIQTVSANPPTVSITSPNGGETWDATGTYTVTWDANDLDGDELTYNVDYSPDGTTWLPIGSSLSEMQIEVDLADLPGSATSLVRVTVTDGVNTVSDQSDAFFTVAEKRPEVNIIFPEESDFTIGNGFIMLQGSGYDVEDGFVPDASLSWSSSIDGPLGIGSIIQANLSPGQHTITLTATDTGNNTGTKETVVNVATCYYLTLTHSGQGSNPVANPGYSSICPTGYYLEGEIISFSDAQPKSGWLITGWTGTDDDTSTASTNTLPMPAQNFSVLVNYSLDTFPPSQPILISPVDGEVVRSTPTYSWTADADAVKFLFEYDDEFDFISPIFTSNELTSTSFTPPLQSPGTYFWHVKARDAAGNWSEWSTYRKVTIKPLVPVAPVLSTPAQGKITNDNTPTFTWKSVPDGYKYRIQISKTNTFAIPLIKNVLITPGMLTYTSLKLADGKYYWRVRGLNSIGEFGKWSTVRNFIVDTVKPAAPLLSSPANNATVTGIPTYKWQTVSGAKYYQFSYATNSTFTNGVFTSVKLTVLSFKPATQSKGTYYWRVRSQDAAGNWSSWSLVRKVILK